MSSGTGRVRAQLPLFASDPSRNPLPQWSFPGSLLFLRNCQRSLRALELLMPMGSKTRSWLNRFFPQLLGYLFYNTSRLGYPEGIFVYNSGDTVFFLMCCFSSLAYLFIYFLISICSYLCIKNLVCLANVLTWKLNECFLSFSFLKTLIFQAKNSTMGRGRSSSRISFI